MKKINCLLFVLTLMSSTSAYSSYFKLEDFGIAAGIEVTSNFQKRGVVTYGSYQVFPIYAVTLFNPDWLLVGSSIYYKFQDGPLVFRGRFNMSATNDTPFFETDESEDFRVKRDPTSELDFYLEYVTKENSYLRLQISQDLKAHKSRYYELEGNLTLLSFQPTQAEKSLTQLGLFANVGAGEKAHNNYLYGSGAVSGFSNYEVGLALTNPRAIDYYWKTFKLSYNRLIQSEIKSASYVKEKGYIYLEVLSAFRLF